VYIEKSFASSGELEVRDFIRSLGLQTEKRKTNRYEIDILVPELNIGIEYNGVYWHQQYKPSYHQDKYKKAKADGIRLIQIFDLHWIKQKDLIKKKLLHALGKSENDVVYARKCVVRTADYTEVSALLNDHHIQGAKPSSHYFGLYLDDVLVSALTLNKNKIERFASAVHVVGGFSKMFAFARSVLGYEEYTTFVDLMWSDEQENQYTKSGFSLVGLTRPNYHWCKGNNMFSRIKFQKHKLKALPSYEEGKSEMQIMTDAGYYRVFDAGNAKLTYR
jgi:hypothetical protein